MDRQTVLISMEELNKIGVALGVDAFKIVAKKGGWDQLPSAGVYLVTEPRLVYEIRYVLSCQCLQDSKTMEMYIHNLDKIADPNMGIYDAIVFALIRRTAAKHLKTLKMVEGGTV